MLHDSRLPWLLVAWRTRKKQEEAQRTQEAETGPQQGHGCFSATFPFRDNESELSANAPQPEQFTMQMRPAGSLSSPRVNRNRAPFVGTYEIIFGPVPFRNLSDLCNARFWSGRP